MHAGSYLGFVCQPDCAIFASMDFQVVQGLRSCFECRVSTCQAAAAAAAEFLRAAAAAA
jgi:hypothetical protein